MPKIAFKTIDDYIDAQPETSKPVLHRLRSILRKALPTAEEVISYGIPAYRLHGRVVLYFAGWKKHYSLYPTGDRFVAATFKNELTGYKMSKGTIGFPLSDPIPAKLIENIAKFRAKEVAQSAKSKPTTPSRSKKKILRPQSGLSTVIPPLSVVKIIKVTPDEPAWNDRLGTTFESAITADRTVWIAFGSSTTKGNIKRP